MTSDASERRKRKESEAARQAEGSSKSRRKNDGSGLSAWQRHMLYVERYINHYERSARSREEKMRLLHAADRNDWDIVKATHRFLRHDGGQSHSSSSYEDEVAQKYYDSLFKDYVIADLKHYKSGNIAMRWRTEDDVIGGIGQFTCANTRCRHHGKSDARDDLDAFEVNFAYEEGGEEVQKNAMVKIILCRRCARKLSFARQVEDKTQPESTSRLGNAS